MRSPKWLMVALMAVALAGCDGHSSAAPSVPPQTGAPSPLVTETKALAAPPSPASGKMKVGARETAERFYGLYLGRQFASSWELLAPAARRQIPQSVWVGVHEGCLSAVRESGTIRSVTVFGNAAIVTEEVTRTSSKSGALEAVFNYANGRWGYSPGDLGIYRRGSVVADIIAAKAAGFCAGRDKSVL